MEAGNPSTPVSPEVRALLALHLVPGLGPRLTAALLQRFGSAEATLRATFEQFQQVPHIGPKLAQQICQALRQPDVDAELEWMARHDVHLLALGSPDYPAALAT